MTLAPVAGHPGVCRVITTRLFSDAWVHGLQAGVQIKIVGPPSDSTCTVSPLTMAFTIVGLPERIINVDVIAPPLDFMSIATNLILALIFDVTGIAMFLRAQNRPTARVTYALFACTALLLCLLNLRGGDAFWLNLLDFTLAMILRGLSATFVCLFPYQAEQPREHTYTRILPYLPLLAGIVLALLSLPMSMIPPPLGFTFIAITFAYNTACILIVIWVMVWGLHHLGRQERQFVRMVVIGIIFLLLPLALALNLIKTDEVIQKSLIRLIPIPLAVLPLACDYALFRRELLGMTSMLSRQAMRGLLWILLASAFVFPSLILLRFLASQHVPRETLDYIFAGLLVASLGLFPLLWHKVRDVGDQVFYHDFYQYNRSLSELSAALTRLQGIAQISAFMLPRLATLLNTTQTGLLLRAPQHTHTLPNAGTSPESTTGWRMYRYNADTPCSVSQLAKNSISDERLLRIANLGLTHLTHETTEPMRLDGVLLLALYDGNRCSGFLCLGPKSNLEPYSKQDYSFLSTLVSQLSVLEVNSRYLAQAQADAQQLAALNHRVLSAQEEERRHLALELHDEALQQAMLVVRQLSDAGTMSEVAEVMPLARSVVASLRRTCLELRPPLLDELGLAEAFRWLARSTEELSGGAFTISLDCRGCWETRPPNGVELALYRIGQEALSNVFKYAGANRVAIRLRHTTHGAISLLISDNGRGLRQKRHPVESLGLVGMHERMAAIGGTLQIRTTPGRGVTIRAMYPAEKYDQVLHSQEQKNLERRSLSWQEVRS
jgi:signal transduction histidine kinase